jgi:leucyl-tRNA synthetase
MEEVKKFKAIEDKWIKWWSEHQELYRADDNSTKPKKYVLVEFPYPSGSGLHVGHAFSFTGGDVQARFKRMQGYNVLFPMGWDAFGLPTENYAIKMKRKPQEVTKENTDVFKNQMKQLAFSFDWSREVNTTDPTYYKWTQWIFVQLFKKGLAYKQEMPINWCPSCKIGLANEEVLNGKCERCGTEVSRRNISQWVVKITDYADRLAEGLKDTNFIDKVKTAQVNWIGKSEGAKIRFTVKDRQETLEVFTTRPDTLYGATFMVISPEHKLAIDLSESNKDIKVYLNETRKKSDMERTDLNKDKTGVFSGLYAINPVNDKEMPIWISDFVLASYGTGAIMSVPAHDERDNAFAKKFGLEIIQVIEDRYSDYLLPFYSDYYKIDIREALNGIVEFLNSETISKETLYLRVPIENKDKFVKTVKESIKDDVSDGIVASRQSIAWGKEWITKNGLFLELADANESTTDVVMVNSGDLNGLDWKTAKLRMIAWLVEKGIGEVANSYHLRDWIFSRQHYWGEPIPMVDCPKCGWVPEKEENLPIVLPEVEAYEPTDDGLSPLSRIESFVNCKCPECGGSAKRETDTMPNWAGSDWYFLRYMDPDNTTKLVDFDLLKKWGPVDIYIGGDEHNTLHLLYSRFIYQFLYDLGIFPKELPEPYYRRVSHGVILGPDNQRMSKSKGNVIVPETVADMYGVDVVRMYLMFMGPFEGTMAWNEKTLMGVKRFLDRFEKYVIKQSESNSDSSIFVKVIINKLVDGVTKDLENFGYNTAIAKCMGALNELEKSESISADDLSKLVRVVAPLAPYMAEELWSNINRDTGEYGSVHASSWPIVEEQYLVSDEVTVVVAINGKLRDQLVVDREKANDEKAMLELARGSDKIKAWLVGKQIVKEIFVPGRMVNMVVA